MNKSKIEALNNTTFFEICSIISPGEFSSIPSGSKKIELGALIKTYFLREQNTMATELEEWNDKYIVSSLVRGLTILSTFTVKRPSLKVSEIAKLTHLDQATVFRFIYTLEKLGYLVRDEDTKRYHQSVRLLSLVLPARIGITVREVALPVMHELSNAISETVKLAVLDGVDIVIVALYENLEKLVYSTPIGHRLPAYCSDQGKVMLAYQPIENWDRLISKIDFGKGTEKTILDPQTFREELLKIRRQGYAIQDGELTPGLGGIAAPIYEHGGNVIAAINISGLSTQILHDEKLKTYIDELQNSAKVISAKLGYLPE
jgi:IclR family transcriptional regulator, pca regulon regulatory protein